MQQSCDVNEKNQEIGILTNNSYACKTKQNIKSLDWNVSMLDAPFYSLFCIIIM